MLRIFLVLMVITFIYSCENENDESSYIELIDVISMNSAKWDNTNISTYMYTYSKIQSDCGIVTPLPSIVVSVVNGQVSSAYIPAFDVYESSISSYLTIKEVFVNMLQEINANPLVFSKSSNEQNQLPEFNIQYGYPMRYYVDKSSADCDSYNVSITEFQ